MSEDNKQLLASGDLKLHLKVIGGDRISIGANGLDGYLNLGPGESLAIRLIDGAIRVTQVRARLPNHMTQVMEKYGE